MAIIPLTHYVFLYKSIAISEEMKRLVFGPTRSQGLSGVMMTSPPTSTDQTQTDRQDLN